MEIFPAATEISWHEFTEQLAEVFGSFSEGEFIVLRIRGSERYVQCYCRGLDGMRIETTSNANLAELGQRETIDALQHASLLQAGWHPPTRRPNAYVEDDFDGSPNFFVDFEFPVCSSKVAALAVITLENLIGVQEPNHISYTAFWADGTPMGLPDLEIQASAEFTVLETTTDHKSQNADTSASPQSSISSAGGLPLENSWDSWNSQHIYPTLNYRSIH